MLLISLANRDVIPKPVFTGSNRMQMGFKFVPLVHLESIRLTEDEFVACLQNKSLIQGYSREFARHQWAEFAVKWAFPMFRKVFGRRSFDAFMPRDPNPVWKNKGFKH